LAEVHPLVLDPEDVGEAALARHAPHERQLATFEAEADIVAAARLLAFEALAGVGALARSVAAPDADPPVPRPRRGELTEIHGVVTPDRWIQRSLRRRPDAGLCGSYHAPSGCRKTRPSARACESRASGSSVSGLLCSRSRCVSR